MSWETYSCKSRMYVHVVCLYLCMHAAWLMRGIAVGRRAQPTQPALAAEQRYCPAFPYKHSQGHCDCVPLDSLSSPSRPLLLHLPAPTIRPSHVPELAIVLPHSLPTPSAASPPPAYSLATVPTTSRCVRDPALPRLPQRAPWLHCTALN
jgi:hypothetical protein